MSMKIGIFDSGVGGEAIALAVQAALPEAELINVNDREHMPYGEKSQQEIIKLTNNAIQPLLDSRCDIIVIACNTATALAIDYLRKQYPRQKFVGIEPMIKSASQLSKNKTVAVCATPGTLSSQRYHKLINKFAKGIRIIEPDCRNWAYLIENNAINQKDIKHVVDSVCEEGADVIVLACTHYHWIKDLVIQLANGRAAVIEPSEAIGRRIKQLL